MLTVPRTRTRTRKRAPKRSERERSTCGPGRKCAMLCPRTRRTSFATTSTSDRTATSTRIRSSSLDRVPSSFLFINWADWRFLFFSIRPRRGALFSFYGPFLFYLGRRTGGRSGGGGAGTFCRAGPRPSLVRRVRRARRFTTAFNPPAWPAIPASLSAAVCLSAYFLIFCPVARSILRSFSRLFSIAQPFL